MSRHPILRAALAVFVALEAGFAVPRAPQPDSTPRADVDRAGQPALLVSPARSDGRALRRGDAGWPLSPAALPAVFAPPPPRPARLASRELARPLQFAGRTLERSRGPPSIDAVI